MEGVTVIRALLSGGRRLGADPAERPVVIVLECTTTLTRFLPRRRFNRTRFHRTVQLVQPKTSEFLLDILVDGLCRRNVGVSAG